MDNTLMSVHYSVTELEKICPPLMCILFIKYNHDRNVKTTIGGFRGGYVLELFVDEQVYPSSGQTYTGEYFNFLLYCLVFLTVCS